MNQYDENKSDFQKDWGFCHEVRQTIPDAGMFDVREADGQYKSGRQRYVAIFLSQDKTRIVAKRDAMQLTSKIGTNYFVCRRHENWKQAEAERAVNAILGQDPMRHGS